MPSLADTIAANTAPGTKPVRRRGPGGVLVEDTPEELQSLSAKAGLAAPPSSPLGAAQIGANPDQQKMVGTPAQKQAATQINLGAESRLADTMRRQQARTTASASEMEEKQKIAQMAGLGDLSTRVSTLVSNFISTAGVKGEEAGKLQATDDLSKVAGSLGVPAGKQTEFSNALSAYLASGGTDANALIQVNKAAGRGPSTALSADQLNTTLAGAGISVGTAVAKGVADPGQVTVANMQAQGGLAMPSSEIASLLGMSEAEVGGLTLNQLQQKVADVHATEMQREQQLAEQATAPGTGAAEQAAAREMHRDLSGVGVVGAEAQAANLETEIAAGNEIEFAGQNYKVEDLLKDETISGLVRNYLADPSSPESRKLAEQSPDLIKLIQNNKQIFDQAVSKMGAEVTKFGELQKKNQAAAQLAGGIRLPDSVMSKLVPGWGEFSTSEIAIPSIIKEAQGNPAIAQMLADPATSTADLSELSGMGPEEIRDLGICRKGSKWDTYTKAKKQAATIADLSDDDLEGILSAAFGTPDTSYIISRFDEESRLAALGLPNTLGELGFLDADHDGKMDAPASIKQRLQGQVAPSLRDVMSGAKPAINLGTMQLPNKTTEEHAMAGSLASKLSRFVSGSDRTITDDEMSQVLRGGPDGLTDDEILWYGSRTKPGAGLAAGAQTSLANKMTEIRVAHTNQRLADLSSDQMNRYGIQDVSNLNTPGDLATLDKMEAELEQLRSDPKIDNATVDRRIAEIRAGREKLKLKLVQEQERLDQADKGFGYSRYYEGRDGDYGVGGGEGVSGDGFGDMAGESGESVGGIA